MVVLGGVGTLVGPLLGAGMDAVFAAAATYSAALWLATSIGKVERRPDGRLWNVPIQTFDNVSQFWTFDPNTFLKQPVYSRDFQGLPDQLKQLGL